MGQTELYREGLAEFRKDVKVKNDHDCVLLKDFLEESATAQEAKAQATELQKESQLKYGRDIGKIPKSWIDNILGNINRFIDVGDYAMKGAPETVGIAWMVTKLTLSAIQNNYELYGFFGEGLTTITEVMTILPHYDKMYDTRSTTGHRVDDFMETLYSDLRSAYSAVLQFCFAIKRHVKGRKRDHVWHGVKDFFGADKPDFQDKLDLVLDQKRKVIEGSNGAFQKRVFDQFTGLGDLIAGLKQDITGISQFADTARDLRIDQERVLQEIGASMIENVKDSVKESFKELAKPKTPWELANDRYQKHMKPLSNAQDISRVMSGSRIAEMGSWIPRNEVFTDWAIGSQGRAFVLVVGKSGSGKTVTASAMSDFIVEHRPSDAVVLSVSGSLTSKNELGQRSQTMISRMTTALMHQLYSFIYRLAETDEKNADLLNKAIDAYRSPKQEKSNKISRIDKHEDGPSLSDMERIIHVLPKSIVKIFLMIDGVDDMDRSEQEELSRMVVGLTESTNSLDRDRSSGAQISALVTCFRTSPFFGMVESEAIDLANETRAEMEAILDSGMQDIPNLTAEIRAQAKDLILETASGRFNYLTEVVIPFIRLPYQGSLLQHLEDLPDTANETYIQAVQKLDAGSVGLLYSALSMTLYGGMTVKVQEILDFFSGTYIQPHTEKDGDGMSSDPSKRPVPSKLQVEQVEKATEPFIKVWHDLEDTPYVELQDINQVQRFCATAGDHSKGTREEQAVCARCAKAVHATHALAFSEKEWHLNLALRCLRHLNHPLFQQRFGLTKTTSLDTGGGDATDPIDTANLTEEVDSVRGVDEEAQASNDESLYSGIVGAKLTSPARNPQILPEDFGQALPDDQVKEVTLLDGIEAEPTTTEVAETTADSDSDSVVDESDDPDLDLDYGDEEGQGRSVQDWAKSRYEIDQWCEHMYTAEQLWPDRGERSSNKIWQELFHELDIFTTLNKSAFELWQVYFFPRYNIDTPDEPWTPLNIAAYLGLTTWAERLMDKQGADPKEVTGGRNALQAAACLSRNQEMLQLLLSRGVDPNVETDGDIPAFHSWIWSEPTVEAVDAFMEYGGDPSQTTNMTLRSVLHMFAVNGTDPQALTRLVSSDVLLKERQINAVDSFKGTPLHRLLFRSPVPIELLKAFIAHGASINAEDEDSERCLQSACRFGDKDVVEVLLRKNEDVNDPDNSGRSAMHQAARGGYKECIDLLINAGADPHAPDHHGRTPLFYACLREDGDAAKHILDILNERKTTGVEINMHTHFGQTPLRQAAGSGLANVVAALLDTLDAADEKSLDILNKLDTARGRTAMHLAVREGRTDVVDLLLKKKANVSIKDKDGKTPLALCTELWALTKNTSFEDIVCLLIDVDPDVAASNAELSATAAMNDSRKVLERLHLAGADLTATDQFGWSPLALARHNSSIEAEEYLRQQTAWAKGLPVRWHGERDGTTLSDDALTVTHSGETRHCLSTERPLPSGLERYYFEITPRKMDYPDHEDYPILAIGFCTHGAQVLTFPGWPPKVFAPSVRSWAYHGDDGGFFSNTGSGSHSGEDRRYKPGDTVGCGFDLKSKTVWFTRNGEMMQPPFENVAGRMFPVIGLRHAIEFDTNFGLKPFVWKGRPISKSGDLEKLDSDMPSSEMAIRTLKDDHA